MALALRARRSPWHCRPSFAGASPRPGSGPRCARSSAPPARLTRPRPFGELVSGDSQDSTGSRYRAIACSYLRPPRAHDATEGRRTSFVLIRLQSGAGVNVRLSRSRGSRSCPKGHDLIGASTDQLEYSAKRGVGPYKSPDSVIVQALVPMLIPEHAAAVRLAYGDRRCDARHNLIVYPTLEPAILGQRVE